MAGLLRASAADDCVCLLVRIGRIMHHWVAKVAFGLAIGVVLALALDAAAQLPQPPSAPLAPVPPHPGLRPQRAPQQQMPPAAQSPQPPQQQQTQPGGQQLEYAFRPDLTNPEFGMCLKLEKNWRALWQEYNQLYNQLRMMNPQDPRYAQWAQYAHALKARHDAAWQNFTNSCVYFPHR